MYGKILGSNEMLKVKSCSNSEQLFKQLEWSPVINPARAGAFPPDKW